MANAAHTISITRTTNARAGMFHGNLTRKAVLDKARASHALWAGLYANPSNPFWKAKVTRGERPTCFGSLKIIVKQEIKEAKYIAECAAFHAAQLDAARNASRADMIASQIHGLEMADFHTAANRAEVARLQGELAKLAA